MTMESDCNGFVYRDIHPPIWLTALTVFSPYSSQSTSQNLCNPDTQEVHENERHEQYETRQHRKQLPTKRTKIIPKCSPPTSSASSQWLASPSQPPPQQLSNLAQPTPRAATKSAPTHSTARLNAAYPMRTALIHRTALHVCPTRSHPIFTIPSDLPCPPFQISFSALEIRGSSTDFLFFFHNSRQRRHKKRFESYVRLWREE